MTRNRPSRSASSALDRRRVHARVDHQHRPVVQPRGRRLLGRARRAAPAQRQAEGQQQARGQDAGGTSPNFGHVAASSWVWMVFAVSRSSSAAAWRASSQSACTASTSGLTAPVARSARTPPFVPGSWRYRRLGPGADRVEPAHLAPEPLLQVRQAGRLGAPGERHRQPGDDAVDLGLRLAVGDLALGLGRLVAVPPQQPGAGLGRASAPPRAAPPPPASRSRAGPPRPRARPGGRPGPGRERSDGARSSTSPAPAATREQGPASRLSGDRAPLAG